MRRIGRRTSPGLNPVATTTAIALCALLAGCGGTETAPPEETEPVVLEPGEMGVVAGTNQRATDQVDANGDHRPDDPIAALRAHLDSPLDVTLGPDGRLYLMDWNGHKIRALDDDGRIAFVVGTGVEGDACEGSADEGACPAYLAQLNHPTGIAFDADGEMLIAAWHNSKIKRYDPETETVRDVCGTGNRKFEGDDGPCRDGDGSDLVSFDLPSSVAIDKDGNLFISDQANQVVRRLDTEGIIKTVVGHCPGTTGFGCIDGRGYSGDDGPATEARLFANINQSTDPQSKIAFDDSGNLFLADSGNNVVRMVVPGSDGVIGDGDPSEEIITTVAGTGEAGYSGDGGPATEADLHAPTDIAIRTDGTLFIADRGNSCVRRVDPDGTISTAAGRCGSRGNGESGVMATEAELNFPYGVGLDADENLYVADTLNHCIRKVLLAD